MSTHHSFLELHGDCSASSTDELEQVAHIAGMACVIVADSDFMVSLLERCCIAEDVATLYADLEQFELGD